MSEAIHVAEVERLRELLAEAEEAIREADDLLTSVMGEAWSSGARIDDELSERKEWIKKPAVLRALGEDIG